MSAETAKTESAPIDDATKKVIADFDEHAHRRARELLTLDPSGRASDIVLPMLERSFCLGYKAGVIDAGQAQRQHPLKPEPPPVILLSSELAEARRRVDDEFSCYFMKLNYVVAWDGKCGTSDHWYEIREDGKIICQVQGNVPLAEFLADLPHLVEGKPGVGPTEYWCACDDSAKLRALLERVRAAAPTSDHP